MTNYWLNKLIFDLQGPDGKDQWTNHREEVIGKYDLSLDVQTALMENDIGTILPLVNPYLMRFFLLMLGYDDDQSIAALAEFQTDEDRKRLNG
tara:strand:+ start:69 stop:347 length:279 start_codon:yes stop_codon:yes gene_type:complete